MARAPAASFPTSLLELATTLSMVDWLSSGRSLVAPVDSPLSASSAFLSLIRISSRTRLTAIQIPTSNTAPAPTRSGTREAASSACAEALTACPPAVPASRVASPRARRPSSEASPPRPCSTQSSSSPPGDRSVPLSKAPITFLVERIVSPVSSAAFLVGPAISSLALLNLADPVQVARYPPPMPCLVLALVAAAVLAVALSARSHRTRLPRAASPRLTTASPTSLGGRFQPPSRHGSRRRSSASRP